MKILFIDSEKIFNAWGHTTYDSKINEIKKSEHFKYLDIDELKTMSNYDFIHEYKFIIFGWNINYISKYYNKKNRYYKRAYIKDLESREEMEKIMAPLLKHKNKIQLTQDLHNNDYEGGINNFIKYLQKYNFYGIITPFKYAYGLLLIKEKLKNLKYFHMPHYLNENNYKDWNLKKEYDVFLFGNTAKNYYPLRFKLLQILNKLKEENKINFLHWNHTDIWKYNPKICDDNLSKTINSSWLTICTKSDKLNFLVAKYFETSMSGSVICGDMPEDGKEIWENNYIHVDKNMSDEEIENIILNSLLDKEKLNQFSKKSLKLMENNYLRLYADDLYNKIQNDTVF